MFWELSGLASLFKNSTPISTLKEKASTHMMFRIILNLHAPWVSGLRGFIITATPFLALSALYTVLPTHPKGFLSATTMHGFA